MTAVLAHPSAIPAQRWSTVDRPQPLSAPAPGMVRLRVVTAGLCRTDVQAMNGLWPIADGRVVGHEFAGRVQALGEGVAGHRTGDRVAVFPFWPCGTCDACRAGEAPWHCWSPRAMGLDVDGAFADWVDVPAAVVFPVPEGLSWREAAYAEPVAASMAPLQETWSNADRVVLLGDSRITTLTERVLLASGRGRPERVTQVPAREDWAAWNNSVDVLIETTMSAETLAFAIHALKPRGLLILKSRPVGAVTFDPKPMVLKQLRWVGANYGDFAEGLRWMADGRLAIQDLLGRSFSFDATGVAGMLAADAAGEQVKLFLAIDAESLEA